MLFINQLGIVCPIGCSHDEVKSNLLHKADSGITLTEEYSPSKVLPLGQVNAPLPSIEQLHPHERSRNNQLALAALEQIRPAVNDAIEQYGANRIGIIIGTSTSGIAESERAICHYATASSLPDSFHYKQQELVSPARILAATLGISGPSYSHSNACASSAKAIASAARLINMGACDAVIAGGVDSLCAFTVAGFAALESISQSPCNPLSANRNGINIGEGAALFLISRAPSTVTLRGWGESSDGHHMSAPDPSGAGAKIAINNALSRAGITASAIDYVNLHGTATVQNDAMESALVNELFGSSTPASSTKPFTGHALGAAGAIEAGFCWLAMQDDNPSGLLPPHLWDGVQDPSLPTLNVVAPNTSLGHPMSRCLSNSFAFGGSNAALILGRE